MIHYSCDRCKRLLDPEEDRRYIVKLEVQAAMEPLCEDEAEDDRDHLLEIHEILESVEDEDCEQALASAPSYQRRHYDLCSACYHKYIQHPLGFEMPAQLGFSQN